MSTTTKNHGIPEAFRRNVRRIRLARNLSQADLAAAIDTPRPRISEMETGGGNPTLRTLVAIADALGVTVQTLLSEKRNTK